MKVTVRVFSRLKIEALGSRPFHCFEMEMPAGSRVKDLLGRLALNGDGECVAMVEGRILKPNDHVPEGAVIQIFRPVFGG